MTVATLLLDTEDNYVSEQGKLPCRPTWDKRLLQKMVEHNVVSPLGVTLLPPSMQPGMVDEEFTLPIAIQEIADTTDMLIVSRSYSVVPNGKRFRLTDYELIAKSGQLEIYFRRDK